MPSLADLSAGELARGYRDGSFQPLEVMRAVADRIERLNGRINAFRALALDEAELAAARAGAAIAAGDTRPLLGIPLAVKDMIDTAGLTTTYGSTLFEAHTPTQDAEVVRRAKRAGAIVVGKTLTDEFAWGLGTSNPHYGAAANPWNPRLGTGGSSGGSAAALAARMVPLALGTDTGGSIRLPAAFCGVIGFKPTFGRISRAGVLPLAPTFDHVGPMARVPADIVALFNAIAGIDPADPVSRGGPALAAETGAEVAGLRVGLLSGGGEIESSAELAQIVDIAATLLEAEGARIHDSGAVDGTESARLYRVAMPAEALHVHRGLGLYPAREREYGASVRRDLGRAAEIGLDEYLEAMAARRAVEAQFRRVFRDVDVLLSVCSATGPAARERFDPIEARRAVLPYTTPQDVAGLPSCAVRVRLGDDGMPLAVQVTGWQGCEAVVMRVVSVLHHATAGVQDVWPSVDDWS